MTDSGIAQVLRRRGRQAGLGPLHPHQLRHTFATSLADSDVNVYTLMRLLGHESMTTTQRYTQGAGKETRVASATNPVYRLIEKNETGQ